MIGLLLAMLLAPPPPSANELAIVSGGQRIVDVNPPGATCRAWSYGAMPVGNDVIYSAGDVLTNHCRNGLDAPDRFGDRIWRHAKNGDGSWSSAPVISRDAFPWMASPQSDAYIGHLASPAVVKVNGKWYMAFVASVSDPNLCAGEHAAPTSCGSCVNPWSYFALMWAVSDDGVTWRVRDAGGTNANPALAASVLWRPPSSDDVASNSSYKALARVSMVTGTDGGKTYFYILGMFWSRTVPKEDLYRIPFDPANPWGLGGDPEVLRFVPPSNVWESCPNGRLPDWVDDFYTYSITNGFFDAFTSSVVPLTSFSSYRYMALGIGHASRMTGFQGSSNVLLYSLSNDLISWTPQRQVRSSIPHFADGRGYTASIIDPIGAEDANGVVHLYLSTNDDGHDGIADCTLDPNFGATGVYVGTGIYEATLAWAAPVATTMTITPPAPSVTPGTSRYVVNVTASDGTRPSGAVVISTDDNTYVTASVNDGVAEVYVPLKTLGERTLIAQFNTLGLWQSTFASVKQRVIAPTHRRAVGH